MNNIYNQTGSKVRGLPSSQLRYVRGNYYGTANPAEFNLQYVSDPQALTNFSPVKLNFTGIPVPVMRLTSLEGQVLSWNAAEWILSEMNETLPYGTTIGAIRALKIPVGTSITYKIYRVTNSALLPANGGNDLRLGAPYATVANVTSWTDQNVVEGVEYFYAVTAVVNGKESWISNVIGVVSMTSSTVVKEEIKTTHTVDIGGDMEMTVTLSENDAEAVTGVAVNEALESASEMTVQSSAPEQNTKINLQKLWNLSFTNAVNVPVTLKDPVTVTIRRKPVQVSGEAKLSAAASESNGEESPIVLNEKSVIVSKTGEGLTEASEMLYNAEAMSLTVTLSSPGMIGLGVKVLALAVDLQHLVIYPNPWEASTNVSGDQKMKLDNLTPDAHIQIYNVLGELVLEGRVSNNALSTDNPHLAPVAGNQGRVAWDLCNQSGKKVASGVYIIVVSNSAGERVIKKVSIVR